MPASTEACWTCRRRRHKCDGTRPRCMKCQANDVECLGYGKTRPLNWVNGVASRGRWKDCTTFRDSDPSPMAHKKYSRSDTFIPAFSTYAQRRQELESGITSLLRHPLMDPMYKDLGFDVRFLIDYFDRRLCPLLIVTDNARNPYREIISRAGSSPVIAKAIVALAACHFSHGVTGIPLFSKRQPPLQTFNFFNSDLERYIRLKNTALRSLSEELETPGNCTYEDAFFAAFLLAVLDLMESGNDAWSVHLEGAKMLISTKLSAESSSHGILGRVANEIAVLDILGSTMCLPSIRPTLPDLHFGLSEMNKARGLTFVGCPVAIISALQFMTCQRWDRWLGRSPDTPSSTTVELAALQANIHDIRQFDPQVWATDITSAHDDAPSSLYNDLLHAGRIWKLAADIYATRVYYSLTSDFSIAIPCVDDMIAEFSFLGPHDSPERCLVWPAFIAGAESTRVDQRDWVMGTLELMWQMTFSANCKNGAVVLEGLWEKQDLFQKSHGTDDLDGWDWVMEMSLQEDQWIFY